MSGLAAIEGELNGIIQEYLEYVGFDATLENFNEDCSLKGKTIAQTERNNKSNKKNNVVINEMVQLFCQGQRKEFFRRWLQNVPSSLLTDDLSAQKLEFELNISFAIYPLRRGGTKIQVEESMSSFKSYLENRGRSLSQTTEFLPYFALPYVPYPQNNQGYQEIFSEAWTQELQQKLENFLVLALKMQRQPKLVEIFLNLAKNNGEDMLKKQLHDAEKRTMAYMKKFNKVQADYHSLIGITAELVDSLENTIRGKPVTSEYLQNICNRLFNSQLSQSIDFTRPGTAGELLRQSLAYQKSNLGKVTPTDQDIPNLDYQKIKKDLSSGKDRTKVLLLQALRWRLTKSAPGDLRDKTLDSYITHDLLNLNHNQKQILIDMLKSTNEAIRQYMARLLNTLASLRKGRLYLAVNQDLVRVMFEAIKLEQGSDTLTFQNLLATMQKLSLRRNSQTIMIDNNVISWLFDLLSDTEILSDYTIENAVALMMNLCLRTSGKRKCVEEKSRALKILSDLLGNSNHEVRPYVNGILYCILSIPTIKDHARSIGLEEILKEYISDDDQQMSTQVKFIIAQMNSADKDAEVESDEDQDDDDDDDEDDQDVMEADLDRTEIVKPAVNELCGENLLNADYSISNKEKTKNGHQRSADSSKDTIVLNRPTTPHQLRQSMFVQQAHINTDNSIEVVSINASIARPESKDITKPKSRENTVAKTTRNFSLNRSSSVDKRNQVKDSLALDEKTPVMQFNVPKKEKEAFETKSKLQRTPNHSVALTSQSKAITLNNGKNINYDSIASTNSSYTQPKYSSFEPRPSSASSNKSKNSSSSGGANQTLESMNIMARRLSGKP